MSSDTKDVDKLLQEFKQMNILNENQTQSNKSKSEKFLEHLNEIEKENCKKELTDKENLEKRFQRLINKIDDEEAREELLKDLKSSENMEKINEKKEENYFLLTNSNDEKNEAVNRKKDLNDVKKKLIEKYKANEEPTKAKSIQLNESLILLQEQTKRQQVV